MEIERNEIVKNELPIKNFEQLGYSIYQDEFAIENEKVANECIEYLTTNLKAVYEFIELLDNESTIEKLNDMIISRARDNFDLYQVGDIINFLETIKIVKVEE